MGFLNFPFIFGKVKIELCSWNFFPCRDFVLKILFEEKAKSFLDFFFKILVKERVKFIFDYLIIRWFTECT